jgi:plastocyanin
MQRFSLAPALLAALLLLPSVIFRSDEKAQAQKVKGDVKKVQALTGPNRWDPPKLAVKVGDVVEWSVAAGLHGLAFNDWDKGKQVLERVDGLEIKAFDFKPPTQATHAEGEGSKKGTLLLRARVKTIPKGMTEIPFFCTVHGPNMTGKLLLQVDGKRNGRDGKGEKPPEAVAP